MEHTAGALFMERLGIASVLTAVFVLLTAARSTADSDYKKICLVSQNLRVLMTATMQTHAGQLRSAPRHKNIKLDAVTAKTRAPFLLPHPSA
jgi:hypothetical protein